ncbi:helix-turn-helix transcriptional regulator [Chryseobacterium sp. S90]|uniref:helix-turn-helix transcriptional regulator n=1 Tax=Chryseobacterium sp. S90 TaxID=3395373 RepID=UPI0039BC5642
MMKTFILFILLYTSSFVFSQSNTDQDMQSVLCYLKYNKSDKAERIIDQNFIHSSDDSKKVIGYVGLSIHYDALHQSKKRMELLKKANEIAEKTNKPIDLAYVQYGYAKYYLSHKEFNLFLQSYNRGFVILKDLKNENFLISMFYNLKARYLIDTNSNEDKNLQDIKKNSIKAVEYAVQSEIPLLIDIEGDGKSLEIFYYINQKNQLIKELKAKNIRYVKQKSVFLIMSLSTGLGILVLIFTLQYKQKINRYQTNLLTTEKNYLKTQYQILTLQRERLQKQAIATSLQLDSKKVVLNELKNSIENNGTNLKKILKEDQLADHDFNELQHMTKEVHPNFFNRIQKISKNKLTHLDMKYAAYIYLNMNNFQISNILKVDPKTVRVTKYRLKQKIGLNKDDDLFNFIQSLGEMA